MPSTATTHPVVLVVEDEFLIRMRTADVIRDAGYEVIEASNADEAIAILESRSDIRVVFTDVRMPGSMDGLKLAHAVRHRWPPVHIIATSGHHEVEKDHLPPGSLFFAKPYSAEVVALSIHALTTA